MKQILKMEPYDRFFCIADQCSFSCCKGWKVIVDTDTYNQWENDDKESLPFTRYIKTKKSGKKTIYNIKMGTNQCCPFLDDIGLCKIVKEYGEDYLTNTCKAFPRRVTSFKNREEYSLSCACPTVVDLLNGIDGNLECIYDGDINVLDKISTMYQIRNTMITILQNRSFSFKNRILLSFYMLLSIRKEAMLDSHLSFKKQTEIKALISEDQIVSMP